MGRIEELADAYQVYAMRPWQENMTGAERVILVVYDKQLERTLRARVDEFRQRTLSAGYEWHIVDMTTWFSDWLREQDYRELYFEDPDALGTKIGGFKKYATNKLVEAVKRQGNKTVVGLLGSASLYGFIRVSELIYDVEPHVNGRLLVFFPGVKNGTNYRLLDARDGWNYLATGITLGSHGGL